MEMPIFLRYLPFHINYLIQCWMRTSVYKSSSIEPQKGSFAYSLQTKEFSINSQTLTLVDFRFWKKINTKALTAMNGLKSCSIMVGKSSSFKSHSNVLISTLSLFFIWPKLKKQILLPHKTKSEIFVKNWSILWRNSANLNLLSYPKQITFVALNGFFSLSKTLSPPPVFNGQYQAGWNSKRNQVKNIYLFDFLFQVLKVLPIKTMKFLSAVVLFFVILHQPSH